MSKTQKIIASVLAFLALVGIVATAIIINNQNTPDSDPVDTTPAVVCPVEDGVITYEGEPGKTAFDILDSLCEVITQTSDFGEFVTSIDNIAADATNYWAFFVNGDYATVGASSYQTQEGDIITWQLETID